MNSPFSNWPTCFLAHFFLRFHHFRPYRRGKSRRPRKMERKAHVVIALLGRLGRPVIDSFGHVDAVAFLQNVSAITFGAAVIKTHRLVVVAVARVVALGSVGGDARAHSYAMLRIEEAVDFAAPATAPVRAALFIAFFLAHDNRPGDRASQRIDFFQHASLQNFLVVELRLSLRLFGCQDNRRKRRTHHEAQEGSDNQNSELRALRVLRGESHFLVGCEAAAQ